MEYLVLIKKPSAELVGVAGRLLPLLVQYPKRVMNEFPKRIVPIPGRAASPLDVPRLTEVPKERNVEVSQPWCQVRYPRVSTMMALQ